MPSNAELLVMLEGKKQEEKILAEASVCKQFIDTPMYELLDAMLAALENEALANLRSCKKADKDEVFALTLRWQERQSVRERVFEQIDINVAAAASLAEGYSPEYAEALKVRQSIES